MKIKLSSKSLVKDVLALFNDRELGIIGKQRIAVYIYSSLILIIGVIVNLFGLAGPYTIFFMIANALHAFCTIILLWFYCKHRISLVASVSIFCIVSQVEISSEIIYCALSNTPYDITLIIANMTLSSIVLFVSVIAYLHVIPSVVAVLSLLTYATSIYLTESQLLANFLVVFFLAFSVLILLSQKFIANATKLEQENINLKDEQQEVLNIFQLSKEQMNAYLILSRNKRLKPEQTEQLLRSVGGEAERHIRENVAYYVRQSSIDFENIRNFFPELSHSELEICLLILKEKKLKEISEELEKSPSNITCQRTNIRAKLGLEKKDNLYLFLKNRMVSTTLLQDSDESQL